MKLTYVIHDKDGETWAGGSRWTDSLGQAARFSSLTGASEALCHLAPGTSRDRFPLRIARWRKARTT